jgi:hypothetical protein
MIVAVARPSLARTRPFLGVPDVLFRLPAVNHNDFKLLFQPKALKTNTPSSLCAKNPKPWGAQYNRMITSPSTISERRAAAARANGKKSRGPVTVQGKANSSGNSFRHGLRSKFPRADPESENRWAATLASFMDDLKPRSGLERKLVETMAFCHLRQTSLWKLETKLMNQGMRREIEDLAPPPLRASHALVNGASALELLSRMEARFGRTFARALDRFEDLCASRSLPIKTIFDERSHQFIENKARFEREATGVNPISTQSGPAEPEPQRTTNTARQTVVDCPSPNPPAECILPVQAAAATTQTS